MDNYLVSVELPMTKILYFHKTIKDFRRLLNNFHIVIQKSVNPNTKKEIQICYDLIELATNYDLYSVECCKIKGKIKRFRLNFTFLNPENSEKFVAACHVLKF